MQRTTHLLRHARSLATLVLAATLGGCGGALSGAGESSAPPADALAYRDLLSYCSVVEPTGVDATRDGWITYLLSADQSGAVRTGMVSVAGSSSQWDTPLTLYVPLNIGMTGYSMPDWNMGVRFTTVLAKQSVACVRQASHIYTPRVINVPGLPPAPLVPQNVWDSYWDRTVPVAALAGRAMSGFELVSNFAPASGDVFFNLDKTRTIAPSSWSVCYLAPKSVQWSCAQPGVADGGSYWQLTVQRPKAGVYVLMAPN